MSYSSKTLREGRGCSNIWNQTLLFPQRVLTLQKTRDLSHSVNGNIIHDWMQLKTLWYSPARESSWLQMSRDIWLRHTSHEKIQDNKQQSVPCTDAVMKARCNLMLLVCAPTPWATSALPPELGHNPNCRLDHRPHQFMTSLVIPQCSIASLHRQTQNEHLGRIYFGKVVPQKVPCQNNIRHERCWSLLGQ